MHLRIIAFLISLLLAASFALGQAQKPRTTATATAPSASKKAEAKLTPEEKLAYQILQTAPAEARGLLPPMRAYVLWEIASGYKAQPKKERGLLNDAFLATLSIDPAEKDWQSNRGAMQSRVLRTTLDDLGPEDVEQEMARCDPTARSTAIEMLVEYYAQHKNLRRAMALIRQAVGEAEFPYDAAATLMLALPKERGSERLEVFSQAVTAYDHQEQFENPQTDLGALIVRFWRDLPPEAVEDAIDKVLKRAEENVKHERSPQLTMMTNSGTANFDSDYQFRVFEFLPILKQIDPQRADDMLQKESELHGMLEKYPNGMQSIDPQMTDKPPDKDAKPEMLGVMFNMGGGNQGDSAKMQAEQQLMLRAHAIAELALKDPQKALQQALAFPHVPDSSAWAEALVGVATSTVKSDPTVAHKALKAFLDSCDEIKGMNRMQFFVQAISAYLDMKDDAAAQATISKGAQLAEDLLAYDLDASDPNRALKAFWPATVLWEVLSSYEARMSPGAALELINTIPDPEILLQAKVTLANAWLGRPKGSAEMREDKKNDKSAMSFQLPNSSGNHETNQTFSIP